MIMANNVLALRMKYRKLNADKLAEIIESEDSTDLEIQIATEFYEKLVTEDEVEEEKVVENKKKSAPKKEVSPKKTQKKVAAKKKIEEDEEEEDGTPEAAIKRQNKRTTNIPPEEELTPEEEERLAEAEAEFDKRQKNRKTPSKTDPSMKKTAVKKEKAPRETKRQNLEESTEVPGIKVGTAVTFGDEDGVVTRIYKSGDGKEKCMVKVEGGKSVKKRVTAVTVVTVVEKKESGKSLPKKKK